MSTAGYKHSEEHKARMSALAKARWEGQHAGGPIGRPISEERRERMSQAARVREAAKAMEAKGYEAWRRAPGKKPITTALTPAGVRALETLLDAQGVLAEYGRSYYRGAVIEEVLIAAAKQAKP